jgi:DNA-binding transcriptional ArsR family regulator
VITAFDVLAEPSRRRILDLLRDGESAVGDMVALLGMSQPAVSKQLRVLRDAGVVEARVDAQRRLYRVRPEPLQQVDDWLAPYRVLWGPSLDALGTHLDRIDGGRHPSDESDESDESENSEKSDKSDKRR